MREADTTGPARWRRTRVPFALIVLGALSAIGGTTSLHAQDEIDLEPPIVEHEALERGVAGDAQEFVATVVDDRELAEVLLFHRFAGEASFDETPMRRLAESSVYTASVPTSAAETRAIEYYIQARDAAGNRVIKGYAFSPLVRRIGDGSVPGAPAADAPGEPAPSAGGTRRWLYIGLGVLAVGAAAAALSDDSSGPEAGPNTFTVTLDPPG